MVFMINFGHENRQQSVTKPSILLGISYLGGIMNESNNIIMICLKKALNIVSISEIQK